MIIKREYLIRELLRAVVLFFVLFATASCKKQNDDILPDGNSTYIRDLPGDTLATIEVQPGKEVRDFYPLLFSFADQRRYLIKTAADTTALFRTDKWDLAFTGPYNSVIFINNANNKFSPGYMGPADRTAILKIDQAYDQVTQAPADEVFDNSKITNVGWANGSDSPGWFFYSLTNHLSVPIKNRTYILRLSSGKYAKLEIQNVYKGNPPTVTDLYWPAPYLNFRYYVQQDGSRNLGTKNQ